MITLVQVPTRHVAGMTTLLANINSTSIAVGADTILAPQIGSTRPKILWCNVTSLLRHFVHTPYVPKICDQIRPYRAVGKSCSKTTFSLTNISFCSEHSRSYWKRAFVVPSQESRQRMKIVVILRHISRNGSIFVVMERFFSYENDPHRSEMTTIVKKN